jgi:hypothetical protein
MRTPGLLLFCTAIFVASCLPAAAGEGAGSPEVTLRGEIVDLACYVGHGAKGPDHQQCAEACARMGQPLGLLTADRILYVLVADHQDAGPFQKVKDLAGGEAELTGETAQRDGVRTLTVHAAKR